MVTITTTISTENYDLCKKNNWKWHEVLARGMASLNREKQEYEKIIFDQELIKQNMQRMSSRIFAIEKKIDVKDE